MSVENQMEINATVLKIFKFVSANTKIPNTGQMLYFTRMAIALLIC